MQRQANQSISPRTGSSIPYGKPSRPSLVVRPIPMLFGVTGVALIAVAAVTALVPDLPAEFAPVLDGLARAGLDKGPLAMFGLLTLGAAFGMRRPAAKKASGERLEDLLEREFQGVEAHVRESGAAVEVLRQELAALKHSIENGFKISEAATNTSQEASNDRIFRLAASLDQLGAQVDRRLDAARDELRSLITSSAEVQREAAEQLMGQMVKSTSDQVAAAGHEEVADEHSPIYTGNPKEAMASFMDDLRSLPKDLLETPDALEATTGGDPDLAMSAPDEPAAALPAQDQPPSEPRPDDGLKLIDQMEQGSTGPHPFSEGQGD